MTRIYDTCNSLIAKVVYTQKPLILSSAKSRIGRRPHSEGHICRPWQTRSRSITAFAALIFASIPNAFADDLAGRASVIDGDTPNPWGRIRLINHSPMLSGRRLDGWLGWERPQTGLWTAIDFVVGSENTRTCNQTAISGWIRIGFIDLPALSLENPSYEADSGACETGAVLRALCVSAVQGRAL
jgi:hypothetical protein